MEGKVVGVEGSSGSEVDGNGGRLRDENVGFIGMVGSGGIESKVGNVVRIEGKGGNVGFGKFGIFWKFWL